MLFPQFIKHARFLVLPNHNLFSDHWIKRRGSVVTVAKRTTNYIKFTAGRTGTNRQSAEYGAYQHNAKGFKRLLPLEYDRYAPRHEEPGAVFSNGIHTFIWNGSSLYEYKVPTMILSDEVLEDLDDFEYVGSIPEFNMDSFVKLLINEEGAQPMENLASYEVEYSRGPRLRVTVHRLNPDDLPSAQDATVADLKSLSLANLADLQSMTGVDILALDEENEEHKLIAQVIVKSFDTVEPLTTQPTFALDIASFTRPFTYLFSPNWATRLDKPMLFRPNPADANTLLCYMNAKDFVRGRLTPIKFGKFIKAGWPDLTDEDVKHYAASLQTSMAPEEFVVLSDTADIVKAYRNGPSSCSSYNVRHYAAQRQSDISDDQLEYHPCVIYGGDSDIHMAVLRKGSKIISRALVNVEKNTYVRIYPTGSGDPAHQKMKRYLVESGYSHDEYCLLGSILNRVELPNGMVIRPYIDMNGLSTVDTGEWLIPVQNTEGFTQRDLECLTTKARAEIEMAMGDRTEYSFDRVNHGHDIGASHPTSSMYKIYRHPENPSVLGQRAFKQYRYADGSIVWLPSNNSFMHEVYYPHLDTTYRLINSPSQDQIGSVSREVRIDTLNMPSDVDYVDTASMDQFIEENNLTVIRQPNNTYYMRSELIETLDGSLAHPNNTYFFIVNGVPYAINQCNRVSQDSHDEFIFNQSRSEADAA